MRKRPDQHQDWPTRWIQGETMRHSNDRNIVTSRLGLKQATRRKESRTAGEIAESVNTTCGVPMPMGHKVGNGFGRGLCNGWSDLTPTLRDCGSGCMTWPGVRGVDLLQKLQNGKPGVMCDEVVPL